MIGHKPQKRAASPAAPSNLLLAFDNPFHSRLSLFSTRRRHWSTLKRALRVFRTPGNDMRGTERQGKSLTIVEKAAVHPGPYCSPPDHMDMGCNRRSCMTGQLREGRAASQANSRQTAVHGINLGQAAGAEGRSGP